VKLIDALHRRGRVVAMTGMAREREGEKERGKGSEGGKEGGGDTPRAIALERERGGGLDKPLIRLDRVSHNEDIYDPSASSLFLFSLSPSFFPPANPR